MAVLISTLSFASKLLNGSSINRTSGFITKALAKATLCCCPPDNLSGILSLYSSICISFKNLLGGRIDELNVDSASVNVVRDKDGIINFTKLSKKKWFREDNPVKIYR